MLSRRCFVLGGHTSPFIGARHPSFIHKKHPDYGTVSNPTLEDYINTAVTGALSSTSVPASLVDRIFVGNFCGELFSSQGHLGAAAVGAHPDLAFKPSLRVEGACASGGLALSSAVDAIQANTADVVLVVGAEVQTTVSAREGASYLARASHYSRQRDIDEFTFPALFARRIKACVEAGTITPEDLAILSHKAYANANRNPLAHMHAQKMSLDDARTSPNFLTNEALAPHIRLSDCSQVSDGGAALILASEYGMEVLEKRPSDVIELKGLGVATGSLYEDGADLTHLQTTRHAANRAFEHMGFQFTASEIGVAEVHDCFTVTEALMAEAVGFCDKGKGGRMVREGELEIGGKFPTNTGGGLVGFGHPVGATGVKQVLEVYRQMKGMCGEYQVPGRPAFGVAANMGGDDKTAVVSILMNH